MRYAWVMISAIGFIGCGTRPIDQANFSNTGDQVPRGCSASDPCPGSQVCVYEDHRCGSGDGAGVCRDRPSADTACPAVVVCGCDGQRYADPCRAWSAGVDWSNDTSCLEAPACGPDRPCSDGFYCQTPAGSCGGTGTCSPRPEGCTQEYRPVCGCDGQTYGNACTARAAGVSIAGEGECQSDNRCGPDRLCGRGQFCESIAGQCSTTGTCVEMPQGCTREYRPVCGCDGQTYGNACTARAAGVSIAGEGECQTDNRCGPDNPCGGDQFCESPTGECGGVGICVDRPQACTDDYTPVCGCDGQTYGNACEARAVGVSVASAGECDTADGCGPDRACPDQQFCDYPEGVCGGQGRCRSRPEACTLQYDPVCGCDGQTHGNACSANLMGVDVAYAGECRSFCGGLAGEPCSAGSYCDYDGGGCGFADGGGTCKPIPERCEFDPTCTPLCGCDGRTYCNPCEAAQAGTDVLQERSCAGNENRCGGFTGQTCGSGSYCDYPNGTCGIADETGVCRSRPEVCPQYFACVPLCGCNGQTYCNPCEAAQAGTDVAYEGSCL